MGSSAQINTAEEDEHVTFIANHKESGTLEDMYNDAEYYNLENVPSIDEIDECLVFYDWLADSGAISHITHRHDAFNTYESIPEVQIAGVGKLKAHAIGQGTV